jgi:ankyrin repeat protein
MIFAGSVCAFLFLFWKITVRPSYLRWFAAWGVRSMVRILLRSGIAVDAEDELGETALQQAAHRGRLSVVKLLLVYGANVHHKDRFGQTPYMAATARKHMDVAQVLRQAGAEG